MAKRSIIFLVLAVALLLIIGFVMLASASYVTMDGSKDDYGMVWKQAAWLAISLVSGAFCCAMNYAKLAKWRWPLLGIALVTLALCYVPGVGVEVNGARRWIGLELLGYRDFRVQPSEFAKVVLVIALGAWYAAHESRARTFTTGFLVPVAIMIPLVALIGCEQDFGSALISLCLGTAIMIVAGARKSWIAGIALAGVIGIGCMVSGNANRMQRLVGFLSDIPGIERVIDVDSYLKKLDAKERKEIDAKKRQQKNSVYAFGSGGVEGVGPGLGRMKLYSLPEPHTDFIFAMVGEELGLQGTLAAVLSFVVIVLSGMCIAAYAPDRFGKLLGFGLTFLFGLEGFANMGVTTALLPNKGLPLPFVSFGGTSLLMAMTSIGILCNIYRQGVHLSAEDLPILRRRNRWTPQV